MKTKAAVSIISVASVLSGCANLHEVNDLSWCDPMEPQVVIKEVVKEVEQPRVEVVNLAADALFKFDKFEDKDLLVAGRNTLDNLAEKLTTGYATVDRIDLVGHTDRLGTEQYNQVLGLNRAKTVGAYLVGKGVNTQFTVSSAGESQPVTDGCHGVSPKQALTDCLQPDRRVVVNITGIKAGK